MKEKELMRDFILLRGIQGSGKSTFIEENDMLIPYTITKNLIAEMKSTKTVLNILISLI